MFLGVRTAQFLDVILNYSLLENIDERGTRRPVSLHTLQKVKDTD